MNSAFRRRALAALLTAAGACAVHAQDATRIVAATVYPDSASVERELKVAGGTRHVTLACVPASVDVATLQVEGDPELRVGDIRATDLPASRVTDCAPDALAARRAELDVQRAGLEARRDSNELALAWLRQVGARDGAADTDPPPRPARATERSPGATAESLRKSALDLLNDQARIKRDLATLDKQATRLGDDQPVARGKQGWRTVRFDVWTPAAAALRVRYTVTGTWWRPAYRASVDTARATMRLERQADIVQASGEDWSDVRIRLSTGRLRRGAQAPAPSTWWIDLLEPRRDRLAESRVAAAPMNGPPPMPARDMRAKATGNVVADAAPPPPPWEVDVAETATATEYALADAATLPSDGQTHTVAIATQTLAVTMQRRATPHADTTVWLLAEAERPAGVWLPGPLQAWRDGALVSRAQWNPAADDKWRLALGQDDRMRVDVETPAELTASTGLLGGRTERSARAVYAVTNLHPAPVTIELLDAAPVPRNEQIRVRSTYEPQPATTEWMKQTGVAAWTLKVAPGHPQRVAVTHVVSVPKDAMVANLP